MVGWVEARETKHTMEDEVDERLHDSEAIISHGPRWVARCCMGIG